MPSYGKSSTARLATCHNDIQEVMNEVIKTYDCSILEGSRTIERQRILFNSGKSTIMNSKHIPGADGVSHAVDVVPYPILWGGTEEKELMRAIKERDVEHMRKKMDQYKIVYARFYHFAGFVQGIAESKGIKLRWGGDWDSDRVFDDSNFRDLPHFELLYV